MSSSVTTVDGGSREPSIDLERGIEGFSASDINNFREQRKGQSPTANQLIAGLRYLEDAPGTRTQKNDRLNNLYTGAKFLGGFNDYIKKDGALTDAAKKILLTDKIWKGVLSAVAGGLAAVASWQMGSAAINAFVTGPRKIQDEIDKTLVGTSSKLVSSNDTVTSNCTVGEMNKFIEPINKGFGYPLIPKADGQNIKPVYEGFAVANYTCVEQVMPPAKPICDQVNEFGGCFNVPVNNNTGTITPPVIPPTNNNGTAINPGTNNDIPTIGQENLYKGLNVGGAAILGLTIALVAYKRYLPNKAEKDINKKLKLIEGADSASTTQERGRSRSRSR